MWAGERCVLERLGGRRAPLVGVAADGGRTHEWGAAAAETPEDAPLAGPHRSRTGRETG